jgi:hypothetical protein
MSKENKLENAEKVPLAFFLDMMEAVRKIGPLRITPGSAKTVQIVSNNNR